MGTEYAVQVTGAITKILEKKAGVPMNRTYVTHEGIPDWGRGNIHFQVILFQIEHSTYKKKDI